MLYSEAAYFDGNHCAHCAARDEHMRLQRIRALSIRALERNIAQKFAARVVAATLAARTGGNINEDA
jgi:hypothetical protein